MQPVVHWCEASVAALAPWHGVFTGWLDDAEQARAARFAFERDRERHVRAHGLLRGVLGVACGQAPAALVFTAAGGAKPRLAGGGPCFSLSHAGDRVVVAWAESTEIGADIEAVRAGIAAQGIAERFFTADEASSLAALPAAVRDDAFTTLWVRKEALVKAWGDGLAADLQGFSVARRSPVVAPVGSGGAGRGWWWQDVTADGPYRAALAGDGEQALVMRQHWPARP